MPQKQENQEVEIWKSIPGYENIYQVSNLGQIKNSSGKIMKLRQEDKGYLKITLNKKGIKTTFRVHQIVMITFALEKKKKSNWEVHHQNDTPIDNKLDNLEWLPKSKNVAIRNKRAAKKVLISDGPF